MSKAEFQRDVQNLKPDELRAIVYQLRSQLYEDNSGINPEKKVDGAQLSTELTSIMEQFGLEPHVVHEFSVDLESIHTASVKVTAPTPDEAIKKAMAAAGTQATWKQRHVRASHVHVIRADGPHLVLDLNKKREEQE